MPDTFVTWLPGRIVEGLTVGTQTKPAIISLTNGNILVGWTTTDDTDPARATGTNLVGRLFDPVGGEVPTGSFPNDRLALDLGGANSDFLNLAALPNGDIISSFEGYGLTVGPFAQLKLQELTPAGTTARSDTNSINIDGNGPTAPNYRGLDLAVATDTSVLFVFERHGAAGAGEADIYGRFYDPTTNVFNTRFEIMNFGMDLVEDPDVAALRDDTFATVATRHTSGDSEILLQMMDETGTVTKTVGPLGGTRGDGRADGDAAVVGLTGGGFVTVWQSEASGESLIAFEVRSPTGQVTVGRTLVSDGAGLEKQDHPTVIPLTDGGFLIGYVDRTGDALALQRYGETGAEIGGQYRIAGPADDPAGVMLADGRVAIAWSARGTIMLEIIDYRDTFSSPHYSPTNWVIGTVGNDRYVEVSSNGDAQIHGWDGNDTFVTLHNGGSYFGGAGNDDFTAQSGPPTVLMDDVNAFDGGPGTDTIDWSRLEAFDGTGNTYDMAVGLATSGRSGLSQIMTRFERLVGTDFSDNIIGDNQVNDLYGGAGDDIIDGGLGGDLLVGGPGSDVIVVDDAADRVGESRKWAGTDTVISSVDFRTGNRHIENVELTGDARIGAGNGLRNTITGTDGDNILDGGKNVDTLIGGAGDDIYLLRAPGDNAVETADGGIDTVRSFGSFKLDAHVEKLFMQTVRAKDGSPTQFNGIGNELGNTIIGTPFENTLVGREGSDTLKGQAGADTFVFDRAIGDGNVDRIVDFNANEANEGDILKLKAGEFSGLSAGVLSTDLFVAGTVATDASDRIIFDQSSGSLWFDADGAGGQAQILFATFDQGASVGAEDILVF